MIRAPMDAVRPEKASRPRTRDRVVLRHAPLLLLGLAALLGSTGCSPSRFLAKKMVSAPNRAPEFFLPEPRVTLQWPRGTLERFPSGTNLVGTPAIPLRWVLVDAAPYPLSITTESSQRGRRTYGEISLTIDLPPHGLPTPVPALGTVFLIHGYGMDLDTLFPWALYLGQAGWRCVLVDLRGHGYSGGERVTFGVEETKDLQQLRRDLEARGLIHGPYAALGHSMGSEIALRWQAEDAAVRTSIALGPPARFAPAVERVRAAYASWIPRPWVARATGRVPGLLQVEPRTLDTVEALRGRWVRGLVVASSNDAVTPPEDGAAVMEVLAPGSELLVVDGWSHETLPYGINQFGPAVKAWLLEGAGIRRRASSR